MERYRRAAIRPPQRLLGLGLSGLDGEFLGDGEFFAQEGEVTQVALVIELEAGLVALEALDGKGIRGVREGSLPGIFVLADARELVHEAAFDVLETHEAPAIGGQVVDEVFFETVQGPEAQAITLEVFIEYMLELSFD